MSPTRVFCLLVAVLALSFAAGPAGQEAQRPSGTAPPAGTGFIAGRVVEPGGQPVAEATVMLLGRPGPAPPPGGRAGASVTTVVSDAQGRFFFANLPPGTYNLSASRTGYLPHALGYIELGENERFVETTLLMKRRGAIEGTLRDTAGDPVVNTDVIAFRRLIVNGRPGLQQMNRARSDDRGHYRLSNVASGQYLVCACSRDPNPFDGQLLTTLASEPLSLMSVAARALTVGADVVSLDDTLRTYQPTFHPNSTTVARAEAISVAPGQERTGVDISLDLVRSTRVSGRVVGAQSPVQASSMRLVPAADVDAGFEIMQIPPMLVQADGRFDFASVPPGQYRLIVTHRETGATSGGPSGLAMGFVGSRGASPPPAPTLAGGPGATTVRPLWADELITVGEGGLSGLIVTLSPSPAIRGRVEYVGSAPPPTEQMLNRASVSVQPVFGSQGYAFLFGSGRIAADRSFAVPGVVPSKYTLSATVLPGYPTLKSVTVAGTDRTDLPIVVADKDLTDVVLTYSDTPLGSLRVTVTGAPPPNVPDDASILLFPVDQKYWADPVAARRRFRSVSVPLKGSPRLGDLPAGEYFVVIASGEAAADWQEPSQLTQLARAAVRVTIGDGETRTIEVRR